MKCPQCGDTATKIRLDIYACRNPDCRTTWFIHRLNREEQINPFF